MAFANYSNLILFSNNSDASPEKLKAKLEDVYRNDERSVKITADKNIITVTIKGWNLYVGYSNEDHVLIESQEIASEFANGKPEQDLISKCRARFEMSADADPDMEYFNDSCFVLQEIESFKEVFVFDTNESSFMNI
jgi:hypothetical protein